MKPAPTMARAKRSRLRRARSDSPEASSGQYFRLRFAELRAGDALDLSRASVDGSHLRVLKGGDATGPSSVDRGKTGSKYHVIVDVHGMPLTATVTGGNRNDVTQRLPLIHAVPPIRGKRGRLRQRPDVLYADRGYDHNVYRGQVRELGIRPLMARRGTGHGSGLGKNRWVAKRPSHFCAGSADCVSAGKSAPTSTRHSSPSAARSPAGGASKSSADPSPQPEPAASASPSGVRR